MFVALNRPGGPPILMKASPDLFCLTDATSNDGPSAAVLCACARNGSARGKLTATTATPAVRTSQSVRMATWTFRAEIWLGPLL